MSKELQKLSSISFLHTNTEILNPIPDDNLSLSGILAQLENLVLFWNELHIKRWPNQKQTKPEQEFEIK